jgi:hypothetical protein
MYRFILAAWLGALSLCASAAPSLYIATVYDFVDGGQSSFRKRVTNTGDSTAFVSIGLSEIIYGQGEPQEIPLHSDASDAQPKGLIATPSRLIIPPKGTQATRLLVRADRDRERYYRVRLVPVVPEKDDAFGLPDAEREAYQASFGAGVNVLTGYGTVLIVRPAVTRFDTRIEQTAEHYSLTNAGNSTIALEALKDCSAGEEPVCEPNGVRHIMPGKSSRIAKQPGRVVRFNRVEGDASFPTEVLSTEVLSTQVSAQAPSSQAQ